MEQSERGWAIIAGYGRVWSAGQSVWCRPWPLVWRLAWCCLRTWRQEARLMAKEPPPCSWRDDVAQLRRTISTGATVALVPVAAPEQNSPHMVLERHNARAHVRWAIRAVTDHAVVAPVIGYVPEGAVSHLRHDRFTGTLSIAGTGFRKLCWKALRATWCLWVSAPWFSWGPWWLSKSAKSESQPV